MKQSQAEARPEVLIWDITSRCNLACIHCYNSGRYESSEHDLSTTQAVQAIDKAADAGFKHIHLLGGEPLLRTDLPELARRGTMRGMIVSINTNGLAEEQKWRELIEAGVSEIGVSIDGAIPETNDRIRGRGTYARIIDSIQTLVGLRSEYRGQLKTISLVFTMTKHNLQEMASMYELAGSLGADLLGVEELYVSGKAAGVQNLTYSREEAVEAFEELAKAIKAKAHAYPGLIVQADTATSVAAYLRRKYRTNIYLHPKNMGCTALTELVYMEANGSLHPCGICNNPLYNRQPLSDGRYVLEELNITEVSSFEKVMNSEYFASFLRFRDFSNFYERFSTCKECEYNGPCRPCVFIHYSDDFIEECEVVRSRIRAFENEVCDKTPYIPAGALWREVNGEVEVWDETGGRFAQLEGIGSDIWRFVAANKESRKPVRYIIGRVCDEYTGWDHKRKVEVEVIDFILRLTDLQCLELREEVRP